MIYGQLFGECVLGRVETIFYPTRPKGMTYSAQHPVVVGT